MTRHRTIIVTVLVVLSGNLSLRAVYASQAEPDRSAAQRRQAKRRVVARRKEPSTKGKPDRAAAPAVHVDSLVRSMIAVGRGKQASAIAGERAGPYSAEISRANKTAILFLIDRSYSTTNPWQGSVRVGDALHAMVNEQLTNLVVAANNGEQDKRGKPLLRDYLDVAVVGYSNDATPIIGEERRPGLIERLPRVRGVIRRLPGGAAVTGERKLWWTPQELSDAQVPTTKIDGREIATWVKPKHFDKTHTGEAFNYVAKAVGSWIKAHPHAYPPTVIHVTDGQANGMSIAKPAKRITSLATSDGNVILFNVMLSSNPRCQARALSG